MLRSLVRQEINLIQFQLVLQMLDVCIQTLKTIVKKFQVDSTNKRRSARVNSLHRCTQM